MLTFVMRSTGPIAVILAMLTTIGCDRVTKHVAATLLAGSPARSYLADTVRLGYVENSGGFLSLGATLPPAFRTAFFTVATGLLLCALAIHASCRRGDRVARAGLALFLAGGLSNWLDRVARGSVVDFLNVGLGSVRTGVFNVADVAITAGVAIFVLAEFRKAQAAPAQAD
jgi:signal peptidase II